MKYMKKNGNVNIREIRKYKGGIVCEKIRKSNIKGTIISSFNIYSMFYFRFNNRASNLG